jgi:hypothetical protein
VVQQERSSPYDGPDLKLYLPLVLLLVAGCAAKVYHPTKTDAEMHADIDRCTKWANDKYWMDPVAALLNAYDCLEELGYRKGNGELQGKVRKAMAVTPKGPSGPAQPCAVPCKSRR